MNPNIIKKIKRLDGNKIPFFPKKEIESIVKYYLADKDKYIDLYKKYSTPLYVFEKDVLKKKALEFKKNFEHHFPDTAFFFAVKCNNNPAVAGEMISHGYGLDVSSGLELEMAIRQNARNIVFSGPGKTEQELTLALKHADKVTILADSFREIEKIDRLSLNSGTNIRVGIRLTTNKNALWRKFGILPEQLDAFWKMIKTKKNIRFCGLQFHTSWNLTPRAQVQFIRNLGTVLSDMPGEFNRSIEFIDIGGGYWPSQGEWSQHASTTPGMIESALGINGSRVKQLHYRSPGTPINIFAEQISRAVDKHIFNILKCRICFEPGRWICNDAVQLLMSVVDKKSDDIVITDMGMNAVGWERFEYDYFPLLNLSNPACDEKPCNVLGCLCTPHDVWGYSFWGNRIEEGDILMIPMQGAYTYSLRQNFIKPLPEFVVI